MKTPSRYFDLNFLIKNKFIFVILFIFLLSLTIQKLLDLNYLDIQSEHYNLLPGLKYFFGTDSLGRDYLFQVLLACKNSILVAGLSSIFTIAIGLVMGFLASLNSKIYRMVYFIIDIMSILPSFIFISILGAFLFFSDYLNSWINQLIFIIILIALFHWMSTARIVTQKLQEVKKADFIKASLVLGCTEVQIFKFHFFKIVKKLLSVQFLILFPTCLMFESYISFLGFGFQLPELSLGILINENWKNFNVFPHLLLFPVLMVSLLIYLFQKTLDKG